MTPEQMKKESEAAMQRMAERLVELGFAKSHLLDIKRGIGQFDWNESGIALADSMKKIFNVPQATMQDITPIEIITLTLLLLGSKPLGDDRN
jgi:hypothetical protein